MVPLGKVQSVSHAMSARLNAAIFCKEFAESGEFVTVRPCQILLPQDEGGGL